MKKNYVKPSMVIYPMESGSILCYSGNNEGSYLPTIPGQPEDEKHLA